MQESDEGLQKAREVLSWISGENDGVVRDGFNMPVEGSKWFIVSRSFLDSWKSSYDPDIMQLDEKLRLDNSDLVLDSEDILTLKDEWIVKPGLVLGKDYEMLPPKAWNYFKDEFGPPEKPMKRKSIEINDMETQVEISLKPVRVAVINNRSRLEFDSVKTFYVSHKATVGEASDKLLEILVEKGVIYRNINGNHVRYYKLGIDFDIEFDDLKGMQPFKDTIIPATLLKEDDTLTQANIADEDLVLVDIKAVSWNLIEATVFTKFKCGYCDKKYDYGIKCKCGKYSFCSSNCKFFKEHSHTCNSFYSHSGYSYSIPTENSASRHGIAGLQNLGNTCFMNSGLQCLSNTWFLTEFLITDRYKQDLNTTNPLGTGGRLVEEFANLVKELWYGSSRAVSPWRFKNALGGFARQFSGYHQHDSQEMLSFLLDGIHEDLNRVQQKPYIEDIPIDGLTEPEMAQKFWEAHISRNQSIIVDNMHGQYRSEVTCPQCNKKSLTFDPFLMITLQIPAKDKTTVDATFIPATWGVPGVRVKVMVDKGKSLRSVKEALYKSIQIPEDSMVLASISNNSYLEKVYSEDDRLEKYSSLFVYETLPLTPDERYITIEIFKEPHYSYHSVYPQKSPLAYPRIFKVDRNIALTNIYRELFEFFSKLAVTDGEFEERFPSFFERIGRNLFTLNFVNPHKKKYSYFPSTVPCPYCNSLKCTNCPVPFSDASLADFNVENMKLEVIFAKESSINTLNSLNKTEAHQSVAQTLELAHQSKHSSVTMEECLEITTSPEQLDENNTTYCSNCKDHVQGTKKMDLYKLPKFLIFHIKRFKQSGFFSSRNNKVVRFPLEGLDMSQYSFTPTGIYDLYAVSNHYGNLAFGHYTAFAKNPKDNRWYEFDDSRAAPVHNESSIIGEAAYVLFYKRRD